MQKSITPIVAAFLLFAVYTSLRISYSDYLFRRNTLDSVERAVHLDPANSRYHAWLAVLLENNGQDPAHNLDTAIRLNPLDSRLWIRRAINAETAGTTAEAEQFLLHAASIDRLMEPRWALMNFYFRTGDVNHFWPWAKQAFAISYGDRTPLFELCWKLSPDAASIVQVLPSSYPIQFQFLQFLLAKGSFVDAGGLAERILPMASAPDAGTYALCTDRLLASGEAVRARRLWNQLCDRRLLPFQAAGTLTNADFAHAPSGLGFDWRLAKMPGVTILRMPPLLRFTFNGQQPESGALLSQTLALDPARVYRLTFEYRTSGAGKGSGLALRVMDQTVDLAADNWTRQSLTFTATSQTGNLAIDYTRTAGVSRLEGTLEIRNLAIGRP